MADDSGGITLRIDADTARYIAEISKAAEATKKLADPTKDLGTQWDKAGASTKGVLDHLVGFAVPLTAAGAMVAGIDALFGEVNKKLRIGKEVLEEMNRVQKDFSASGLSGKEIEDASERMRKAAINLNESQLAGIVNVVRGPGGAYPQATPGQLEGIARKAGVAAEAGMDPVAWANAYSKLEQKGVAGAEDKATFTMRHITDDRMRGFALGESQANPKEADFLLRMSSQIDQTAKGPARMEMQSLLQTMTKQWRNLGQRGSLQSWVGSGVGAEGNLETWKQMKGMMSNLPEIPQGEAQGLAAANLQTVAGQTGNATDVAKEYNREYNKNNFSESARAFDLLSKRAGQVGKEFGFTPDKDTGALTGWQITLLGAELEWQREFNFDRGARENIKAQQAYLDHGSTRFGNLPMAQFMSAYMADGDKIGKQVLDLARSHRLRTDAQMGAGGEP